MFFLKFKEMQDKFSISLFITPNMNFPIGTKLSLCTLLILIIFVSQSVSRELSETHSMSQRHRQWMVQCGRVYKSEADRLRGFQNFKDNVERIETFNAIGTHTYKLGINAFTDQSNEEFVASRTGLKVSQQELSKTTTFRYENTSNVPLSMDWRMNDAVTPIKDQGGCGSCWAFSTIGAIEGMNKLSTGNLISLTEQQLVSCNNKTNYGCWGGFMIEAFEYVVENGGVASESEYPYLGTDGTCNKTEESTITAIVSGYERVPTNSEEALLKAVANQPVSVAIDAWTFSSYSGGVFTDCSNSTTFGDLNHGVTAVGYGETSDGIQYWLLKNSWGNSWGEEGFMRLLRNVTAKEGMCGIAIYNSYPIA